MCFLRYKIKFHDVSLPITFLKYPDISGFSMTMETEQYLFLLMKSASPVLHNAWQKLHCIALYDTNMLYFFPPINAFKHRHTSHVSFVPVYTLSNNG